MQIHANGAAYAIEDGTPLSDFLTSRGLAPQRVVVERNGEALTPSEAKSVLLEDGDQLEIVRIVAGG